MYDTDWHKLHADKTATSANHVLNIVRQIHPFNTIVDVGCGTGIWLKTARDLGATVCKGIDGPWTDQTSLLVPAEDVKIQNLSAPSPIGHFDLAVSVEVAEHVERASEGAFLEALTQQSDLILFSAAIPHQGGFRHVNEQWQSHWAGLFDRRGFDAFDVIRPQIWASQDVHFWYKQNVLLYAKRSNLKLIKKCVDYRLRRNVPEYPKDLVHPERYQEIASYKQIAFKPLIRELPRQTLAKIKSIIYRKS